MISKRVLFKKLIPQKYICTSTQRILSIFATNIVYTMSAEQNKQFIQVTGPPPICFVSDHDHKPPARMQDVVKPFDEISTDVVEMQSKTDTSRQVEYPKEASSNDNKSESVNSDFTLCPQQSINTIVGCKVPFASYIKSASLIRTANDPSTDSNVLDEDCERSCPVAHESKQEESNCDISYSETLPNVSQADTAYTTTIFDDTRGHSELQQDASVNAKEDPLCQSVISMRQGSTKRTVLPKCMLDNVTTAVAGNQEAFIDDSSKQDIHSDSSQSKDDFLNGISSIFKEEKYSNKRKKKKRKHSENDYENNNDELEGITKKGSTSPSKREARPNYFLAVQIQNSRIKRNLEVVQQHVLKQEGALRSAAIALPTVHITLMVMSITNDEQLQRAMDALDACKPRLEQVLQETPLVLTVSGIDSFRDQVVFAKLGRDHEGTHTLHQIAETVSNTFAEFGFNDDGKSFKPHITLFKLSKIRKKDKKKVKKIPQTLYAKYSDCIFGCEAVKEIQLCAMLRPKQESGYYHVEHVCHLGSSDDSGDTSMDVCDLTSVPETHVCLPQPKPGKRFKAEFEKELTWTFHEGRKAC